MLVHERAEITARGDALPEARRTVLPRARVAASATTRMGAKASMAAMKGMWVLTSVTTGVRVRKSFRWETREEREARSRNRVATPVRRRSCSAAQPT